MEIIKALLIYSGVVVSGLIAVLTTEALFKTVKEVFKRSGKNE